MRVSERASANDNDPCYCRYISKFSYYLAQHHLVRNFCVEHLALDRNGPDQPNVFSIESKPNPKNNKLRNAANAKTIINTIANMSANNNEKSGLRGQAGMGRIEITLVSKWGQSILSESHLQQLQQVFAK